MSVIQEREARILRSNNVRMRDYRKTPWNLKLQALEG